MKSNFFCVTDVCCLTYFFLRRFDVKHFVVLFNAKHGVVFRVKHVVVLLSRACFPHKVQFCFRELDYTRFIVVTESLITQGSMLYYRDIDCTRFVVDLPVKS